MAIDNETYAALKLWIGAMAFAITGGVFHWHGKKSGSPYNEISNKAKIAGFLWNIGASCFVVAIALLPAHAITAIANAILFNFGVKYSMSVLEVSLPIAAFFGFTAQSMLKSSKRVWINFIERGLPDKNKTKQTDNAPL